MQAYVITIKDNENSNKAADRCIKTAADYGIEVEKFEAFTPKDNPELLLKERNINPTGFQEVYSRLANCQAAFLSHYTLWEKCAFHNEPFLIFEHDAVVVGELPRSLNFMHCMTIGKPSYGKFNTPTMLGEGPLVSKQYFPGAHAYYITPKGAQQLVDKAKLDACPTDIFINNNNFT